MFIISESEGFKLREQFAKTCFETLLQFSLLTPSDLVASVDLAPNSTTTTSSKFS